MPLRDSSARERATRSGSEMRADSAAGSADGSTCTSRTPARTRSASARCSGLRRRTCSEPAPTDALSWPLEPSAMTFPWSITAMRSASWSASSRYCVVNNTVVPSATKPLTISHPGEILIDRRELPGKAHPGPYRTRITHDVVAEHLRLSGVGAQERGEHADRGGLTRPVRAEYAVHATGAHGQIHTGDRVGLAEALLQPSRLDRELSHGFESFSRCCERIG